MKKVIALITGVVVLTAIIIVSFFGTLAYTKEKNIYCDYVVMNMITIMHDDETAVEVLKRPKDSEIKVGDPWYDNEYNYRINVIDWDYLNSSSGLEGKFQLHCEAKTLRPGKLVSDPTLKYYVQEPTTYADYIKDESLQKDFVEINNKDKFTSIVPFTIKVQSNDPKGKYTLIRLQMGPYKTL